jgi:hypothetical protein
VHSNGFPRGRYRKSFARVDRWRFTERDSKRWDSAEWYQGNSYALLTTVDIDFGGGGVSRD